MFLQDDKAKAEALSSSEPGKSQASEPGWVTNWEDSKPSSQAGHVQESKAELPRTFGPMQSQNLDGFLQSTSSSAPKQEKKHARTGRCPPNISTLHLAVILPMQHV